MKTIKITVDGKAAGGGGFYFEVDVCSGQAGDGEAYYQVYSGIGVVARNSDGGAD
ncbi:hypothetical protein [Paenibacillus sp. AN1007]|uniref:PLAT domain-containing protein n=1 Tax=Paenibacillus sp. AN1007 TaxID=3151385 RepID=A0AAU8N9W7_9BACL